MPGFPWRQQPVSGSTTWDTQGVGRGSAFCLFKNWTEARGEAEPSGLNARLDGSLWPPGQPSCPWQVPSLPAGTWNLPAAHQRHAPHHRHTTQPLRAPGQASQKAGAPGAYRPHRRTPPRARCWALADDVVGRQDDLITPLLLQTYRWKETGVSWPGNTSLPRNHTEGLGAGHGRPQTVCGGAASSSFPGPRLTATVHVNGPVHSAVRVKGASGPLPEGRVEAA